MHNGTPKRDITVSNPSPIENIPKFKSVEIWYFVGSKPNGPDSIFKEI